MTPQQFKAFKKLAGPLKILYAGVGDKLREPPVVDLMLPTSEVERANTVFASIGYVPKNDRQAVPTESLAEAVKKRHSVTVKLQKHQGQIDFAKQRQQQDE